MQTAPCPTAQELAVGTAATVATAPSASDAQGRALVDVLLRRGLTHPDSFTALNNLFCAIAEEDDPVRAATGLRALAREARTVLGDGSLTAVRVAANAAAFTGIAGDVHLAHEMHRKILSGVHEVLPPADLQRVRTNATHWSTMATNSARMR